MKERVQREPLPVCQPLIIYSSEQLPVFSSNREELGKQLALLYVNGIAQSWYYESEHRPAIQGVLLCHTKLLANVHVDTYCYMGMQEELRLKQLQIETEETHAALQESPSDPIKQVEYGQALQAENTLLHLIHENSSNLPGYAEARKDTYSLIEDLSYVFSDTERDREHQEFPPMPKAEAEELAIGVATELGILLQYLGELHAD